MNKLIDKMVNHDSPYFNEQIIKILDTKFALVSYNNEGFISYDEMESMLKKYGKVESKQIVYNTFRGSRNLRNRTIHTNEFLFLLDKRGRLTMDFGYEVMSNGR